MAYGNRLFVVVTVVEGGMAADGIGGVAEDSVAEDGAGVSWKLRPLKLLHDINFFFFFTMISRRGLGTRRLLGLEAEASKPESAVLLIPPLKTTTPPTTTTHYVLSALETVRAPSYFFSPHLFFLTLLLLLSPLLCC